MRFLSVCRCLKKRGKKGMHACALRPTALVSARATAPSSSRSRESRRTRSHDRVVPLPTSRRRSRAVSSLVSYSCGYTRHSASRYTERYRQQLWHYYVASRHAKYVGRDFLLAQRLSSSLPVSPVAIKFTFRLLI